MTVSGAGGDNNATTNFTLPHRSVSIWVAAGKTGPAIGSITPRVANAGASVTISGAGFGKTARHGEFCDGRKQAGRQGYEVV